MFWLSAIEQTIVSFLKGITEMFIFEKQDVTPKLKYWCNKRNGFFSHVQYTTLFLFTLFLIACAVQPPSNTQVSQPERLAVSEGFVNPIGFYDVSPSFSWVLPSDSSIKRQSRYRIVAASSPDLLPDNADLWNSNVVISDRTTFVPYNGVPLSSRQKVYWQVKFWDSNNTESKWSDIADFELGLLSAEDWKASWIEIDTEAPPALTKYNTPIHVPQYLRKLFNADNAVKKARLYITAKGLFEAYINGKRVGNDVLTPGYTPYAKRIETLTYDVTDLILIGKNAIGLTLAEGWYAGRFGPKRHWHKKREITPKVLAQLEIEFVDGSHKTLVTDESWRATQQGPLRQSTLYDGERYDANFELTTESGKWHEATYNIDREGDKWRQVKTSEHNANIQLEPKRHFTSTNKQILTPISVDQKENRAIFDLGQNMVGVVGVKVPLKRGQTLKIRYAEGLNSDGTLFTGNLGSAAQEDFYTARDSGVIEWQPQFTFHGFRYVELSGYDEEVKPVPEWVEGIVRYTDFELTGEFATSAPELNQLQSNIEWGLKGNFLDIPTDCPQRSERLGWTGDALAFAPTSLFVADSHAFWSAWLKSVREEQFENHGIPVVVPNEVGEIVQAGWSDAAVTIPWDVYWSTGDTRILAENYQMMTRWIQYHHRELENGISKMWTVGDWLQPYSTREDSRRGETDHSLISTAFYAHSLDVVARTARVLGKNNDAVYYEKLFKQAKHVFQQHFFDSQGKLKVGDQTQTSYLLAIGFDLLDQELAKKAKPHLLAQFQKTGGHLRTGFLGTPLIAPVLEKIGRPDIALELVFKETYPSWLYSVSQGATTMWERWDGFTHDGGYAKEAGSLNHYAYGAIGQWLYERLAGISPLNAGYKKVRIAPLITERLSYAEAKYQSPHGTIGSRWSLNPTNLILEIAVPPNVEALVEVPAVIFPQFSEFDKGEVSPLAGSVFINGKPIAEFRDNIVSQPASNPNVSNYVKLSTGHYIIKVKRKNDI